MRILRLYQTLILFAFAASPVAAQTIDMDPGSTPVLASDIGFGDRNVVFQALQSFALTSAGIRVDPIGAGNTPFTLTAWLWSMADHQTRGRVLATSSMLQTGTQLQFYDVPIVFALLDDQLYNIGFTVSGGWGFSRYNMEFYRFSYPGNAVNIDNMVTVIDGGASTPGEFSNGGFGTTVMPHVQLNVVADATVIPEPSSVILLATGMIGVFALARRRSWAS